MKIFRLTGSFCQEFELVKRGRILTEGNGVMPTNRKFSLSDSEVINLLVPIQPVTKIRKNMKNSLMLMQYKMPPVKRAVA